MTNHPDTDPEMSDRLRDYLTTTGEQFEISSAGAAQAMDTAHRRSRRQRHAANLVVAALMVGGGTTYLSQRDSNSALESASGPVAVEQPESVSADSSGPNPSPTAGATPAPATPSPRVSAAVESIIVVPPAEILPVGNDVVSVGVGNDLQVTDAEEPGAWESVEEWDQLPKHESEQIMGMDSHDDTLVIFSSDPQASVAAQAWLSVSNGANGWATMVVDTGMPVPHPATFWRAYVRDLAVGPDGVLLFGSAVLDIDVQALAPELSNPELTFELGGPGGQETTLRVLVNDTGEEVGSLDLLELGFTSATLDFVSRGATTPMVWKASNQQELSVVDHAGLGDAPYRTMGLAWTSHGWLALSSDTKGDMVSAHLSQDGAAWTTIPAVFEGQLAGPIVEANGNIMLPFNNGNAHVWLSADGGTSWTTANLAGPLGEPALVHLSGGGPGGLALVLKDQDGTPRWLVSTPDGVAWSVSPLEDLLQPGDRVRGITVAKGQVVLSIAPDGLDSPAVVTAPLAR